MERKRSREQTTWAGRNFEFFVPTWPPSGQARARSSDGLEPWDCSVESLEHNYSLSRNGLPCLPPDKPPFPVSPNADYSTLSTDARVPGPGLLPRMPFLLTQRFLSSYSSASCQHLHGTGPNGLRWAAAFLHETTKATPSLYRLPHPSQCILFSSLFPLSMGVHSMVPAP